MSTQGILVLGLRRAFWWALSLSIRNGSDTVVLDFSPLRCMHLVSHKQSNDIGADRKYRSLVWRFADCRLEESIQSTLTNLLSIHVHELPGLGCVRRHTNLLTSISIFLCTRGYEAFLIILVSFLIV